MRIRISGNGKFRDVELPVEDEVLAWEMGKLGNDMGRLCRKCTMAGNLEINGGLYGALQCKITEPLTEEESSILKDYWTGQMSDGWGESF